MEKVWKRKEGKGRPRTALQVREGVPFLYFPALEETGAVVHGFSTRLGGVSQGMYAAMNVSFTRGDREEAVRENYRRLGKAMGFSCDNLYSNNQTQKVNVRGVTEAKGIASLFTAIRIFRNSKNSCRGSLWRNRRSVNCY